jgi:hypothetical protein
VSVSLTFLLSALLRIQRKKSAATMRPMTAAPTAIPAMAPVERPLDLEALAAAALVVEVAVADVIVMDMEVEVVELELEELELEANGLDPSSGKFWPGSSMYCESFASCFWTARLTVEFWTRKVSILS